MLIVIALVGLSSAVWGQNAGGPNSGRALLDQAIAALGGDAFLNVKTEKLQGRMYEFRLDRLTGLAVVVEYIKHPDKRRIEYGKKKEKDDIEIFDGDRGWDVDVHGTHALPADELKTMNERDIRSGFYILRRRLNEPDSTVEYTGRDIIDNREVDLVNFIDGNNETVAFALDHLTHLPSRVVWVHRDPKTRERIEETEIFSNYLTAQGVTAPRHIMRKRDDRKTFEAFIQDIQYNMELLDSLFAPTTR
jgi:hypothetical protein